MFGGFDCDGAKKSGFDRLTHVVCDEIADVDPERVFRIPIRRPAEGLDIAAENIEGGDELAYAPGGAFLPEAIGIVRLTRTLRSGVICFILIPAEGFTMKDMKSMKGRNLQELAELSHSPGG